MRAHVVSPTVTLLALTLVSPVAAQSSYDPAEVVRAIESRLDAEVSAFESKDCETALSFYEDQSPLFVVGGRAMPSREDLATACPGMVARIPEGARRPVQSQTIHPLGPTSGYSVTEFLLPIRGPFAPPVSQFVTKIWELRDSGWVIVHVHESVDRPDG